VGLDDGDALTEGGLLGDDAVELAVHPVELVGDVASAVRLELAGAALGVLEETFDAGLPGEVRAGQPVGAGDAARRGRWRS
jgi:hypothetical protein